MLLQCCVTCENVNTNALSSKQNYIHNQLCSFRYLLIQAETWPYIHIVLKEDLGNIHTYQTQYFGSTGSTWDAKGFKMGGYK